MPLIRHLVLVSCLLALLAALPSARAASMAIDSLAGPVTQNEINSFKLYMATQIPPVTPWGALNGTNNDHNHWADGDGGNDLEAFGLMYEISGDVTILTNMIGWADYCVSQRNDLMSPTNGGQRVMWTGNIDKVWCPNEPTTAGAAYAGGENGDTKAHLALCALEILNTPSLWNTTVPDGNPYGYGVTYFQRATNYIEKCDEGNLEYDLKYFLTNNLIRNPTNWPTGYHTMEANNIQMMLDGSWERLAQCHEILGDNPALLARYDAAVNGSGNECLTGMEHAYLTNGIPVYKWYYYPPTAPQAAGDNPIENVGHAAYDMVGMSRAFMRGLNGEGNPYGFPRAGMIPFANALAYVMNRATNIFAGEVDGTGSTQNYMQAQWLLPADWNPVVYDIVATADYASGRYKTTTLMEATMLWMKNRRYQGFSVTPVVVTKTVAAGAGASFPVTVAPLGGFSNTVSLALSGLPPGANASFNFSNLNIGIIPSAATNSTLAITTSNSTPPGTYPLTIMGTGGGLTHNASVTLVVGTYSTVVSPASQTVPPGGSTAFTMTVATNSGFSSSVNFGLAGLPANVNAGFSPASLSGAGTSTLNVTTATNAPAGNYTLTFYGTNGTAVSSATAILNITVTTLITNSGALVWTNGAGNLNWSGPLNWTNLTAGGNGPPGPGNSVIFTNYSAANASALTSPGSGVVIPANINSAVNTSFTIAGLTNFANSLNTSPLFQNLGVANGATLATGGIQIGGFAQYDFGLNNVVNTTISGAGATLLVTNGAVIVSQGSNTGGGGAHDASLDLSGLDTFVMNGTQLKLGVENITRAGGVLYLAKTNLLTLTDAGYANSDGSGSPFGGNPALYLGHNKSAFGNGAQLYLGISNSIAVDYVSIGRGDTNGLLKFNPAFLASNPSATISGLGGAGSRVGVYIVGDGSSGQGGSFVASNDFSGGTVNALVNYLCVGRGRQGASDTTTNAGVLTLTAGDINAGLLTLGCLYPSGSNSAVLGTVNVNGGTLTVITNLTLATRPQPGGAGSAQATLNVNGGTVQATNITGGGGLSTINLASGTIDLSGGGPFAGSLVNVSGLNLGAAGVLATALLENAATISISNVITIAPNGTLAGNPVITAPGLIVNGILSPGVNGIGAITNNGPVTLGAGGDFFVSVQNADGAPVTGWDFLQVNGGLNVQSSNTGPFTVQVQSFDPAGSGQVTNFSADTSYAWPVAAAAGGITNFNATKIIADGSLFQNDLAGGYFYVGTNNNSLVLSFTNNHPPAAGTVTLYRTGATMAIPLATLAAHWSDPDGDPVVLTSVDSSTNGAGLGTDGAYIYYTNANVVADAIFYTVQDVRTNPPAVYRPGDTQRTAAGEIILLPPPAIGGVSFTGANLLFRVANGVPGGTNYVLSSTNLALPLNQWTITATNTFDAGGGGNFTNSLDPNAPQTYYLLRLQ